MTERNIEYRMIFASSCVESAARALGISAQQMYERMKRVNLIEGYILKCYDVLHAESRDHVTKDVLATLGKWESKEGLS